MSCEEFDESEVFGEMGEGGVFELDCLFVFGAGEGVIFGALFGERLFDAGLAEGVPALDGARRVLGGVLLGAEKAEQLLLHRI